MGDSFGSTRTQPTFALPEQLDYGNHIREALEGASIDETSPIGPWQLSIFCDGSFQLGKYHKIMRGITGTGGYGIVFREQHRQHDRLVKMGFQIDTSLGSLYSEMVALIACLDLVEQRIRRLVAEPFRFAGSEPRSFHFTVFSDCDNALTAIQRCNQTTLKTLSGTLSTIFRERKDSLINRMRDGLCVYVSGGLKWTPGHVFWLHEQADKIAGRACKEKRNIYMIDDAEISDQLPIVNAFKDDIRDAFIVEQARLFAALSLERRRGRGKKRRDSLAPINPGKVTKTTGTAATPILPNIFKTITESHVEPALGFDVTLDAADRSANSEPSSHTQQIISTGISFADDLATEISSTDINPSRRSSAAKIFRLELLREMADKLEKERQEREWSRMAEEQLYEEDAVAYDRHICETGRFHKYDDE